MISTIRDALEDLKIGKMIIVIDDEDRENEGDLVMAAEFADQASINFMTKEGRGLICVPVEAERAQALNFYPMAQEVDGNCNFAISVDAKATTTTGISAAERAATIQKIIDPEAVASDFVRPGHMFPLIAKDGGTLVRAGHTEASIDLMKLAKLSPAGVICEIMNEDGSMARLKDLEVFSEKHDLKIITIQDLIEYRTKNECLVKKEAVSSLNTKYGEFKIHVYTNSIDKKEHVALTMGDIRPDDQCLVRVHSECMTGDIFGSQHCDCGEQLDQALGMIAKKEQGVLLYMRQEGRGIGLVNKIKAYDLQNKGYDTVEANHKLGFKMDLRDYGIGAQILADLGVQNMELMTNNPRKIVGLEGYGIQVNKRVPIEMKPNKVNIGYLKVKKSKMGHLFSEKMD